MKKSRALIEEVTAIDPIRGENLERSAEEESAKRLLAAILESGGGRRSAAPRPTRRRWVGRAGLAACGAIAIAAALFLGVLGSGEGPTGNLEFARGAELQRLARISPHLLMAGDGWHVIGVESRSKVAGHAEFFLSEPAARSSSHFRPEQIVEFRWHSSSLSERGRELQAAGFVPAKVHQDFFTGRALSEGKPDRTAQVYVPRNRGAGPFPAIGLWQQSGRAFELRSRVESVRRIELDLERFLPVSTESWISALEPSLARGIDKIEVVRRGKNPDGSTAYTRKGLLSGPNIRLRSTDPELYRRLVEKSLREAAGPLPLIHANGRVTLDAGRLSIHGRGGRLWATTHGYGQLWLR